MRKSRLGVGSWWKIDTSIKDRKRKMNACVILLPLLPYLSFSDVSIFPSRIGPWVEPMKIIAGHKCLALLNPLQRVFIAWIKIKQQKIISTISKLQNFAIFNTSKFCAWEIAWWATMARQRCLFSQFLKVLLSWYYIVKKHKIVVIFYQIWWINQAVTQWQKSPCPWISNFFFWNGIGEIAVRGNTSFWLVNRNAHKLRTR